MRRSNVPRFTWLAAVLTAAFSLCPNPARDGGAARAQNPAAPETGGLFVPKPRDAQATLDDSALGEKGDTVSTRAGDRLTGAVTGVTRDGLLLLTAPCFNREVSLFTSALSDVRFASAAVEVGRDQIVLTNGDLLCGNVTGMTAGNVALENSVLGLVKVPNRFIQKITFRTMTLARTDFSTGQPAPLLLSGVWQVSGGALLNGAGQNSSAALALDQNSAITVILESSLADGQCTLAVFSDKPDPADGGNSLNLNYTPNTHSISVTNGYSTQAIASNLPGRTGYPMVVRFAYDPAASKVKLWVQDKLISETKAPTAPKEGKYIVLAVHNVWALNRVQVLSGVVAPPSAAAESDDNNDVVVLADESRYLAEKLVLADGVFTLKAGTRPIEVPVAKVASLNMRKVQQQIPPAPDRPVQIVLPTTLLTVQLLEMNDKTAVAKSPCLGDLRIDRGAIRMLRFLAPAGGEK